MLTQRQERTHFLQLYLISFLLVAMAHLVSILLASQLFKTFSLTKALNSQPNITKEKDKNFKVRLLGFKNAKSHQGDLHQLKAPDKIFESKTPQKALQANKQIKARQNVARVLPNQPSPVKKQEIIKKDQSSRPKQLKKFSLSDLGKISSYQPLNKSQKQEQKKISYRAPSIQQYVEQARIFENLSGKLANLNLKNISSSVQIEIPKGNLKEDELNPAEKRFYSFKRRVFQAYVQSLLTQAYNQQTPSNPFPFTTRSTSTTAKVTYDEQGNFVRLKILRPTKAPKLQQVFITALRDIETIPNPPKEIINGFGEFSQIYILNITF